MALIKESKHYYELSLKFMIHRYLIILQQIFPIGIGGDPGGGGGRVPPPPPPSNFSGGGGGRPPSIFESLKNIYSYICILNTMKVIQSV